MVIPLEACYLGWRQSLNNLAMLTRPGSTDRPLLCHPEVKSQSAPQSIKPCATVAVIHSRVVADDARPSCHARRMAGFTTLPRLRHDS